MTMINETVIDLASVIDRSDFAKRMMETEMRIAQHFTSITAADAARNNLLCLLETLEHHAITDEPLPPEAAKVLYGYLLHTLITMNSDKAENARIILPNAANY